MSEIVIKIMVQVLSVLSLATKQIKQGRLSEPLMPWYISCYQICLREICEKVAGRKRD
jgi:hypothetical protein